MASFSCSACGAKLKHSPELAGKRFKCPKCGQVVTVPEIAEAPPPALLPASTPPAAYVPPTTYAVPPPATIIVAGNPQPRLQAGGWFSRAFSTTSGIIVALLIFALVGVGLPVVAVCGGCALLFHNVGKELEQQRVANSPRPVGQPASTNTPAAAAEQWHPMDQPLVVGEVLVRVRSVSRGKVPLTDFRGKTTSQDDLLIVRVAVENTSTTRKVDLIPWNEPTAILGPFATLKDDAGNLYKRVEFGFGTKVGAVEPERSLYPGKSTEVTLVFELPIDAAKELRLEMDAAAIGKQGDFRFAIPAAAITAEPAD